MSRKYGCVFLVSCLSAAFFLSASAASAHGIVGRRLFIEPLVTEDANPKNELDLPLLEIVQLPGGHLIGFNYSVEKKLLPRLSVSFDNSIVSFAPNGQSSVVGFGNIGMGVKYALYQNAAHEFILSPAFHVEAPTGNTKIGAASYATLSPEFLYAKGFGDLPSHGAWKWFQPLAVQGDFALDFPVGAPFNSGEGRMFRADAVLEYSLPYLNAFVRHADSGYSLGEGSYRQGRSLGAIVGNLVPFNEFNFSWVPDSQGRGLRPQGYFRPGMVYVGHYFEVGGAAEFPANHFTGSSVGALGLFDLFFDDVLPKIGRMLHR